MVATVIPSSGAGSLERAIADLEAGNIVAIPTETVYGLAVLPDEVHLRRLIAAKRRSADKGVALLVDSIEQARSIARMTPAAESLAARFWPGALTLVVTQRTDRPLPDLLTGGRPTIGVRLPDHDTPRELARRLGPIAVSSANVSGEADATTAAQVVATLGDVVALVLDDGPVRGGVPSSVVHCPESGGVDILRVGAISEDEIRAAAK